MVEYLFYGLFLILPLVFFPKTSEVFEFNKIVIVYIFTVLISASWVIKMIRERKLIFKKTVLDIPLLLFLGSQIISTFISIDQRTSIFGYYSRFNGGLLSTICYIVLYFVFVSNMDKIKTRKAIIFILISAILVAVYGILEHFGTSVSCLVVAGKFNDDCWVQDVQTRVFATLGQPNWLAATLTSLVPLTWYFALNNKKNKTIKETAIWISVSIIFFACILFTKSRSGLLGLFAAYVIFWIFNFRKNLKLFFLINLILLLVVLIFGTPWTPKISNVLNHTKQVQQTATDTSEGGTESGAIREIVWKGAIDIWKANPVFGTGVETFGYSYWQYRPEAHNNTSEWDYLYNKAHNEYLNFAANTGSVGLISYLILVSVSIYILRKNSMLLAGYVSILITNFFGFSVVVISLFTFLFPAIAIATENKLKDKEIKELNNNKLLIGGVIIVAGFLVLLVGRYWYADYLYAKGQSELQNSQYKESVKDNQSAIDYSPTEGIYHNQMSRIFTDVAVGLYENNAATDAARLAPYALNESDIAFSLSPRNMNIRETRISTYLTLAKFDPQYLNKAIDFTKETIVLSPTDPKLRLILGKTYANMGKFTLAEEEFNKALELKPDYGDAKDALAVLKKLEQKK